MIETHDLTNECRGLALHRHRARSFDAVIGVYDPVGNVIEAHEHEGEFKEA